MLGYHPPPRADTPWSRSPWDQAPPKQTPPGPGTHPEQTLPQNQAPPTQAEPPGKRHHPLGPGTPLCSAWEIRSTSGQSASYWNAILLPPANEVCEGYVFTGVCLSTLGGIRGFIRGHVWFYSGGCAWFYLGDMHGFIWGVCVVLFVGHVWFYLGGMRSFIWGVCGFIWGVCMVFPGGMHGFFSFFGYNEIRSMSGWYASYWNAFLLNLILHD